MNTKIDFSQILESWGSPFVARSDIQRLTGGLINPRTLANLDCLGKGPAGRFRVGRRVAYPVAEVIKWMESKSEVLDDRESAD